MIKVALDTGMRISELTALQFEDCHIEGGACRIHVKEGKYGKDRMLWMSGGLAAELGKMAEKEGRERSGLIFQTRDRKPLDHGYLRRMIKKRGTAAGVPRLHWHLLRHTALTRTYSRTKDIRKVQDIAGHSSPNTTAIYTHVSGADIREAMLESGKY